MSTPELLYLHLQRNTFQLGQPLQSCEQPCVSNPVVVGKPSREGLEGKGLSPRHHLLPHYRWAWLKTLSALNFCSILLLWQNSAGSSAMWLHPHHRELYETPSAALLQGRRETKQRGLL